MCKAQSHPYLLFANIAISSLFVELWEAFFCCLEICYIYIEKHYKNESKNENHIFRSSNYYQTRPSKTIDQNILGAWTLKC